MKLLIEVPQGTQEVALMFLHGYTDKYGVPGSESGWFPCQSAWDMVDSFIDAEAVIEFTGWATSVAEALFVECDDGKEYFLYSGQRHSMNGGAKGYSDIMRTLRQLVLEGALDAKPADYCNNGILWPVHMEVGNIARWKTEVIFYETSKPWWNWWESEASISKRAWKMYEELSAIGQL